MAIGKFRRGFRDQYFSFGETSVEDKQVWQRERFPKPMVFALTCFFFSGGSLSVVSVEEFARFYSHAKRVRLRHEILFDNGHRRVSIGAIVERHFAFEEWTGESSVAISTPLTCFLQSEFVKQDSDVVKMVVQSIRKKITEMMMSRPDLCYVDNLKHVLGTV